MRIFNSILFVILSLTLITACRDQEQTGSGFPTPEVRVSTPIQKSLQQWHEFTGRFRAINRVEIRARVSGYIEAIKFRDGQRVQKGDVLFVIDQRPFKIALQRALSQFELAQKELSRSKSLRQKSVVAQQDLDKRAQEFQDAKAAYEQAQLNLEFTEVKSPTDGRVGRHLVDIGNLVTGGDVNAMHLTTVVVDDPIHFYFEASEAELLNYMKLNRGKAASDSRRPVYIKILDDEKFNIQGYIDFVDNELDRNTGSLQMRAIVANPKRQLYPGLFGRLRVAVSDKQNVLLVPDDIIGTNQTKKFVYVLSKDNKAELRIVNIGALHEQKYRVINEGLTENDKVITEGIARLRPGVPVKVLPDKGDN
jgi:membrane fusion protein, multidrug efflux system